LIAFSHVLLNDHTRETQDNFAQAVAMFPEVKSASVVFLSSIAAQVIAPLFSVYSASKAALNAIAKTEIAKTVVHLCEDSSAYITGAEILIDGGMALS